MEAIRVLWRLMVLASVTLSSGGAANVDDIVGYSISTIAGGGGSGDGYPATSVALYSPTMIYIDSLENVYITDRNGLGTCSSSNCKVRKVSASTGIITTIAGTGILGSSGDDGAATLATLKNPDGVYVDGLGNVYLSDRGNHKVRKVATSTGTITTFAGTGSTTFAGTGSTGSLGDGGLATLAALNNPQALYPDSLGNIYIGDIDNHKIRKVAVSTNIITTIAGTGSQGSTGDGGLATLATLNRPHGVCVDSLENIYIADSDNHKIRKVAVSTNIITTIAGTGSPGSTGDGGLATLATLRYPYELAVDSSSNVFIADNGNNKVRMVATNGIITIIAGTGTAGYSGDGGIAISAQLNGPLGMSVDSSGNIYITDFGNNRIRLLTGI